MSISASDNAWLFGSFSPVGMDFLDARAAMLERVDNKYILGADVLARALNLLLGHFDILEIDGRQSFSYENCYFDGPGWQSYFDHHQGRRQRSKVRMRKYVNAGLCFVEVKLKDKRGITVKKRLPCHTGNFGILDQSALDHVELVYRNMYGRHFPYRLDRTLDTRYNRTTLVARQGGERMTIDTALSFFTDGRGREVGDHLFVVETKSASGNGLSDRVLRALHQRPLKHCSKYCIGMALMQAGLKHNNFKPTLRRVSNPPCTMAGIHGASRGTAA